jgi:hypothetical protein
MALLPVIALIGAGANEPNQAIKRNHGNQRRAPENVLEKWHQTLYQIASF